jgi:hypothetical protein
VRRDPKDVDDVIGLVQDELDYVKVDFLLP